MNKKIISRFLGCVLILGCAAVAQATTDVEDAPYGDSGIFGGTVSLKPNVLIIFDTSGSMNDTIPTVYSSSTTYSGSYTSSTIYYRRTGRGGGGYTAVTSLSNLSASSCSSAITSLSDSGYWTGTICVSTSDGSYTCTSGRWGCGTGYTTLSYTFYMGNYLNYSSSTGTETKLSVAKDAIEKVLANQVDSNGDETMRMGLMRFDHSSQYCGGYIVLPCGTDYLNSSGTVDGSTFYNAIESISTGSGNTPLAESLAEAGLYFAGTNSWAYSNRALPTDDSYATSSSTLSGAYSTYNSTGAKIYKSPIQWRCQKNYIILFTDGESTADYGGGPSGSGTTGPNIFTGRAYLNNHYLNKCLTNTSINDYDCDGVETSSSLKWLDDVSKFLFSEDLRTSTSSTDYDASGTKTFDDSVYETQNVITYTVGFGSDTDTDLLISTSENGGSGGEGVGYFNALSSEELVSALTNIMSMITANNATFVAPVVPASRLSGSYSGNAIYLGMFKPMSSGIWRGNLKKYGYRSSDSMLMQKDGILEALDADGDIIDSAYSVWTEGTAADGANVDEGGLGAWLLSDSESAGSSAASLTRKYYTNDSSFANTSLATFDTTNTDITTTLMNLGTSSTVEDYMNWIKGIGSYSPSNTSTGRTWLMGDVLHSRPAIVRYGYKNAIFVGANDGFLYCIEDDEVSDNSELTNLSDDTVSVKWCYVPYDIIYKLHEVRDDTNREYFVDGSPVLYTYTTNNAGTTVYENKSLTFGLRRGGSSYYTLNVGTVDSSSGSYTGGYASPSWRWRIDGSTFTTAGSAALGQSWSSPYVSKYKLGSASTNWTQAMILAGGYDESQDDLDPSEPTTITTSDTKGRCVYSVYTEDGSLLHTLMPASLVTFSIVDFLAFDRNNNNFVDSVYAGDMGGNVYAARDKGSTGSETGAWDTSPSPFKLFSSSRGSGYSVLKMFNAPDVTLESWGDYVFIGTGDREHPNAATVTSGFGYTQTVDRFYGIKNKWEGTTLTESSLDDVTDADYDSGSYTYTYGWYFKLSERVGEKVVSSPVIYDGIVYFTTYTPPDDASSSTVTDLCATGDLGVARLYAVTYTTGEAAYNWNESNDTTSSTGSTVAVKDKTDRSTVIGTGLSTQPSIVVTSDGAKLLIATQDGITSYDLSESDTVNRYFWRQD